MERDDAIVFLNSEIVDDDDQAATGVLLDSSGQIDDEEELEMLDELDEIEEGSEEELLDEDEIIEEAELIEDEDITEDDELIEDEELVEEIEEDVEDTDVEEVPEKQSEGSDEQVSELSAKGSVQDKPVQEEASHDEPAQKQKAPRAPREAKKPSDTAQNKKPSNSIRAAQTGYVGTTDDKLDPYNLNRNAATEGVWAAATITVKRPSKKKTTYESDSETDVGPAKRPTKKPADEASELKTATSKNEVSDNTQMEAPSTKAPAKKKTTAKKEEKNMSNEEEKVLIEADESKPQHGKFVIKKTDKGNFVYKLFSSNKRVLAVPGGAYKDLASCKGGIQSVINNAATAPIEDQTLKKPVEQKCPKWEIYLDNKNEFRLRLIASNGNVVAITNDGYMGKDAAKKGIDAIARAAQGASVVRNDDLW